MNCDNTTKIASWNINSLNVRLEQVIQWLKHNPVDILGLQELKLTDDKFPYASFEELGYHCSVFGQKTYNGVALLSRNEPAAIVKNNPYFEDPQARIISLNTHCASGKNLRIINAYVVNGQEPGSEKFEYKLAWFASFRRQIKEELARNPYTIIMGDFNIALEALDSYDEETLAHSIHHTDEERYEMHALLSLGFIDALRAMHPSERIYSWWDYREGAFQRNKGLRIDYILTSSNLKPFIQSCHIDKIPRKNNRPSDHAPVILELNNL